MEYEGVYTMDQNHVKTNEDGYITFGGNRLSILDNNVAKKMNLGVFTTILVYMLL